MRHRPRQSVTQRSPSVLRAAPLVMILLGGCTSLPDTSGYTAATIEVKQSVATAGQAVEAELSSAIAAGATSAGPQSVAKFNAAWRKSVRSLDAMVAYAQSIEQIVDAGNQGADSARQVAASVKKLADAVKVDALTGSAAEVFGVGVDTAAFVYGEISKAAAAATLEESLTTAGPALVAINGVVLSQIADARRLFVEQIAAQERELQSGESGYGNWIELQRELMKKHENLTNALVSAVPVDPDDAELVAKVKQAKADLSDIETAQKQIAPRLAEYEAKLAPLRQREKAGLGIVGAAENAVAAWGRTHQSLVQAIKQRKPVSIESLAAAAAEVRTLIQRWREL